MVFETFGVALDGRLVHATHYLANEGRTRIWKIRKFQPVADGDQHSSGPRDVLFRAVAVVSRLGGGSTDRVYAEQDHAGGSDDLGDRSEAVLRVFEHDGQPSYNVWHEECDENDVGVGLGEAVEWVGVDVL